MSRDVVLDRYLSDISGRELLSREEEVKTARLIEEAADRLFEQVLASGIALPELDRLFEAIHSGALHPQKALDLEKDANDAEPELRKKLLHQLSEARRAGPSARRRIVTRMRLSRRVRQGIVDRVARDVQEALRIEKRLHHTRDAALREELLDKLRTIRKELGRPRADLAPLGARLRRGIRDLERARAELTEANLRLVILFARRYRDRGVPLPDLIQEGNLALMHAVERFDVRFGTRFSTYASWWIKQAVQRAVIDQSAAVRMPVHLNETLQRLGRVRHNLRHALERDPTLEELAEAADLSPTRVKRALTTVPYTTSLDAPLFEDSERSLGTDLPDEEHLGPEEALLSRTRKGLARELLAELDSREHHIVSLRLGFADGRPRTLQEIGEEMGLSRERIRQIEACALEKLRKLIA